MTTSAAFDMYCGWRDAIFPPILPTPHICAGANKSYIAVRVLDMGSLGSKGRFAWVRTECMSGPRIEFKVKCWEKFGDLLQNTCNGDRLLIVGGKFAFW